MFTIKIFMNNDLIYNKILAGQKLVENQTILHTAPHHDDIILSYHPYIMRNIDHNQHHILYATSGYRGVSNDYIMNMAQKIEGSIIVYALRYSYEQLLQQCADSYQQNDYIKMLHAKLCIFVHVIAELCGVYQVDCIVNRLAWIRMVCSLQQKHRYDQDLVHEIKGRIRESESDIKWMISMGTIKNIHHFRADFYHEHTVDLQPDIDRLMIYLEQIQPDIITVALDPYTIGPKNHFTTLQVITCALQNLSYKDVKIIGYRNVWSNFDCKEASHIMPLTQNQIDAQKSLFLHCFTSQSSVSFVGTDFDGNFAEQVEQIQKIQWQQVCNMMEHPLLMYNETTYVGAIFLKQLTYHELYQFIQI